jgi:hypothetical protein
MRKPDLRLTTLSTVLQGKLFPVKGFTCGPAIHALRQAWVAGRSFDYTRDATLTVWSLTLPQVAATLAATLVAYDTMGAGGQRLLDRHVLNAVLVLVVLRRRFLTRC